MSTLLFSKKPIILLSFTADEFYLHYHEILEEASMLSLLDFVTGVPIQQEVNALDLTRKHFYEEQLMSQQKNDEDEMRFSLFEEIKLNHLKVDYRSQCFRSWNHHDCLYPIMNLHICFI